MWWFFYFKKNNQGHAKIRDKAQKSLWWDRRSLLFGWTSLKQLYQLFLRNLVIFTERKLNSSLASL